MLDKIYLYIHAYVQLEGQYNSAHSLTGKESALEAISRTNKVK